MHIDSLAIQPLDIPFKLSFSHATADRSRTQSVLVTATSKEGLTGYGEGCPREYVTGESLDSVMRFFREHQPDVSRLFDLDTLRRWVSDHRWIIDANPAAWCAMEMALLDLFGKTAGLSLERLLDQPELSGVFQYSAVLGTDDLGIFEKLLSLYLDMGFRDFKVKLMDDLARDQEKADLLKAQLDKGIRIRFDANNCWTDADRASRYLESLDCPFWAVEEPLPKGRYEELARLAEYLDTKIILDESFRRLDQLALLDPTPDHWLVNLRVSKMGGLLRSLEIVDACRKTGIPLIVGAQVGETSLLTRAALTVAASARDLLVAQEGGYGTYLLAHDICEPSLMFGRGGKLNADPLPMRTSPGCGLDINI
ncbi:MAG: enolase C-terminal domain-like protein [Pseudomonadota bacterium]